MPSAFIVAGCRTPIGKFLGGLSSVAAPQLGAVAIAEAIRRAGLAPERIDEVIMGNVLSAGLGQAPARQAALKAGLPPAVAALTINKMCGSGLKAVMLADTAIRAGDARAIVAGGMENMSRAPYLLGGVREGWKFGSQQAVDSMIHDGLWCACENLSMGAEADYIADKCSVPRAEQDAYALASHQRAVQAMTSGAFAAELAPVSVAGRKGAVIVDRDEGPRADSSLAALAALKASFEEQAGIERTVTAGNASQISDGAAAVVVVDERIAAESASPLRARIVAQATSGVRPKEVFIAPVAAIEQVLAKAKLTLADIDLVELNEAFAAQVLACGKPLKLDPAKLNVHGGAIALGHPIGASGARVLVTLLYAMQARGARRGLAALCLGGGNAVAMIVERAH
ncbi:MAG TPA: acetyl-CoA C-acyltransferase [Pirellulales bacterium]|nr:acetyl-CoA C-acyltransferase [Pirellulales bacterium]